MIPEFNTLKLQNKKDGVHILIDGVSLVERLRDYELSLPSFSEQKTIAGGYAPVQAGDFLENRGVTEDHDDFVVLGCTCGEVDCWPMVVRETRDGDEVMWSNFWNPFRNEEDYSKFSWFVFNTELYDEQVRKVKNERTATS